MGAKMAGARDGTVTYIRGLNTVPTPVNLALLYIVINVSKLLMLKRCDGECSIPNSESISD